MLLHSCVLSHSAMSDFAALWTIAHQAPLSMGFPRQEYWSRLPFPLPEDLADLGIELHWQVDSLPLSHLRNPLMLLLKIWKNSGTQTRHHWDHTGKLFCGVLLSLKCIIICIDNSSLGDRPSPHLESGLDTWLTSERKEKGVTFQWKHLADTILTKCWRLISLVMTCGLLVINPGENPDGENGTSPPYPTSIPKT